MVTTPNLGLTVWNLESDGYDNAELADDMFRLDDHDHTPGKGRQVPTAGIQDGAITAEKLDPALATALGL